MLTTGRLISTRLQPLFSRTSTSAKISDFSFSLCLCSVMPAFGLQQVKTKYRSGVTQALGYLPRLSLAIETLDQDYHSPKQFGGYG